MESEFEAAGAKVLLSGPESETDTVVVLIPGVSGGARTSRFAPVVPIALERGYALACVDMWGSEDDVNGRTVNELFAILDVVCAELIKYGYRHVILIGKSFGGGLALGYHNPAIVQKILWAPAFTCVEQGNLGTIGDVRLGSFASVKEVHIGQEHLAVQQYPVGIIHGTADSVISLENSQKIVAAVPNGTLVEVEGADHSFKTPEQEHALMEATKGLLQYRP